MQLKSSLKQLLVESRANPGFTSLYVGGVAFAVAFTMIFAIIYYVHLAPSKAVVRIGRERMPGIVSNVTPLSRNGVISFTVRLDDDANPRLRSGLKTDVYIMCDVMEDVKRIKNGTFYTGPGSYDLYVFNGDNELTRRSVKLGDSNFEFVEIISGLEPGDRVVINDMKRFGNSNTIKVK